jgi:hypothetical protein
MIKNILKNKAIKAGRNGMLTFYDSSKISEIIKYNKDIDEEYIVLFKPSVKYWVLLTDRYFVYFKENKMNKILYEDIINNEVYFHKYESILFEKKILCDHLKIVTKMGKIIILPIEALSVFSFSEPLNYILTLINYTENR